MGGIVEQISNLNNSRLEATAKSLSHNEKFLKELPKEVWVCAYKIETNKGRATLNCKPTRAAIMTGTSVGKQGRYFVLEYKKDKPTELKDARKAMSIHYREVFRTEQECRECYNRLVNIELEKLNLLIEKVKGDLIKE